MTLSKQTYLIITLLTLCLVGCGVIVTPDATPTPTPFVMQSLFTGDTCAPPCWFGLTPGVSTAEDVELFLQTYDVPRHSRDDNIIDPETGYIVDGDYGFFWGPWYREDAVTGQGDVIIQDGVVFSIRISMNQRVNLRQVIEMLGQPDYVRHSGRSQVTEISLIYLDERIRVYLNDHGFDCFMSEFTDSYWVDFLWYYSPEAAANLVSGADGDELQPAILQYKGYDERHVPTETWETWISGTLDMRCSGMWESLPDETFLPSLLITPTATP